MFSRFCPTSLIKFPKIFHFIYWQFGTIWNSLEPFSKVLHKFRVIPSKIPCFSENVVTWKISLRIRYDSYIGILRPFGTISDVFEKSSAERSAEDSVIPCFPESAHFMVAYSDFEFDFELRTWVWTHNLSSNSCSEFKTRCHYKPPYSFSPIASFWYPVIMPRKKANVWNATAFCVFGDGESNICTWVFWCLPQGGTLPTLTFL